MKIAEQMAEAVVLSFIEALNQENFQQAREYVNEDLKFEGVLGSRNGATTYLTEMGKMKFKYHILKSFADENDVCLLYNIDMGDQTIFTCGWYQLQQGKISRIKVVFDPRPLLAPSEKK